MIKENTIIHGNAKYIVRFGEIRIGLPGQQPVKFLKYDEANKLIAEREMCIRDRGVRPGILSLFVWKAPS